ncbi:hypothetical protein D8674_001031 [Pyrus ussuriensis x Pyrus communis]|uniref:Uncharacterized protein n=1 Tax=Pyrus ussuriensis x Pyrus communis TaxID=2448454 RepID=A0A5N5F7T6_9ROSA|nr:hypothetical protein D8674_001031 [Pyrus ussuriensis x Pyrus communis]
MYGTQSPHVGLLSSDKPTGEWARPAFPLQGFGLLLSYWTRSDCLKASTSLGFLRTSPKPENDGLLFSHVSGPLAVAYELLGSSHPFDPKL